MVAVGRRRRKRGSGGKPSAERKAGDDAIASRPVRFALWPNPGLPVLKSVSFDESVQVHEIEGDERDEFTFDNKWDDGTPKVR